MNKVGCDIINDILPLYIDDVVCEATRKMVDDHLADCRECMIKGERMKWDMEKEIKERAAEAEKNAMIAAKKKIRKKRMATAFVSGFTILIILIITVFALRNIHIPIRYVEDQFTLRVENEYNEEWLYLYYGGIVSGHNLIGYSDEENKTELFIEMYTTPWDKLFAGDQIRDKNRICICSLDEDHENKTTKVWLIDKDSYTGVKPDDSAVLLWENPNK